MAMASEYDLTLQHPAVNGGAPVGFILVREGKRDGLVKIERARYINGTVWVEQVRLQLRIVLSDELVTPGGTISKNTRSSQYGLLGAFLAQRSGLLLEYLGETWTDLRATLAYADESRFTKEDVIEISLNNGGFDENLPARASVSTAGSWWFDAADQSGHWLTIL